MGADVGRCIVLAYDRLDSPQHLCSDNRPHLLSHHMESPFLTHFIFFFKPMTSCHSCLVVGLQGGEGRQPPERREADHPDVAVCSAQGLPQDSQSRGAALRPRLHSRCRGGEAGTVVLLLSGPFCSTVMHPTLRSVQRLLVLHLFGGL